MKQFTFRKYRVIVARNPNDGRSARWSSESALINGRRVRFSHLGPIWLGTFYRAGGWS